MPNLIFSREIIFRHCLFDTTRADNCQHLQLGLQGLGGLRYEVHRPRSNRSLACPLIGVTRWVANRDPCDGESCPRQSTAPRRGTSRFPQTRSSQAALREYSQKKKKPQGTASPPAFFTGFLLVVYFTVTSKGKINMLFMNF
jgi:hypothetical protein